MKIIYKSLRNNYQYFQYKMYDWNENWTLGEGREFNIS